jgi:hypothetical protein
VPGRRSTSQRHMEPIVASPLRAVTRMLSSLLVARWSALTCGMIAGAGLPDTLCAQRPIMLDSSVVVARGVPSPNKPYTELKDGRLLIHSAPEKVVLLIDPVRRTMDTIGREGRGPGEYVMPISSRVLSDGRIAVLDPSLARLTTWTVDGKPESVVAVAPFALHFDADLDQQKRVYWGDVPAHGRQFLGPGDRPGRHPDSTWLYRLTPPASRYDTVAALVHREAAWIGSAYKVPLLYGAQDAWGVLPDGTLWIARVREHRVDRLPPGRPWSIGPSRAWEPVHTTAADERLIPDLSRNPRRDSVPRPMAKIKPPFDYALASDDGEVWTHLSHRAGSTRELFAVFPPSGPSRTTVSLPLHRRVVRLSRASVYALFEDEDGEWILEQYPRPAGFDR